MFFVQKAGLMAGLTGMADTGVVNFNAHLTSLGGSNLDVLNGQRRAGLPGDGSLSIVQHCFINHKAVLVDVICAGWSDRAYLASDCL